MHKPKDWMLVVKVEVHALALLEQEVIGPLLISPARFYAAQNANQAFSDRMLSGQLAGALLLGEPGRSQIFPGPTGGFGHLFSRLKDASGQLDGIVPKALEQHPAQVKVSIQRLRLMELTQGRTQPQAVKSTKNSHDLGSVLGYKRASDVVRWCFLFHSATHCDAPI